MDPKAPEERRRLIDAVAGGLGTARQDIVCGGARVVPFGEPLCPCSLSLSALVRFYSPHSLCSSLAEPAVHLLPTPSNAQASPTAARAP